MIINADSNLVNNSDITNSNNDISNEKLFTESTQTSMKYKVLFGSSCLAIAALTLYYLQPQNQAGQLKTCSISDKECTEITESLFGVNATAAARVCLSSFNSLINPLFPLSSSMQAANQTLNSQPVETSQELHASVFRNAQEIIIQGDLNKLSTILNLYPAIINYTQEGNSLLNMAINNESIEAMLILAKHGNSLSDNQVDSLNDLAQKFSAESKDHKLELLIQSFPSYINKTKLFNIAVESGSITTMLTISANGAILSDENINSINNLAQILSNESKNEKLESLINAYPTYVNKNNLFENALNTGNIAQAKYINDFGGLTHLTEISRNLGDKVYTLINKLYNAKNLASLKALLKLNPSFVNLQKGNNPTLLMRSIMDRNEKAMNLFLLFNPDVSLNFINNEGKEQDAYDLGLENSFESAVKKLHAIDSFLAFRIPDESFKFSHTIHEMREELREEIENNMSNIDSVKNATQEKIEKHK